jgi:hypothetical protein
MNTIKFNWNVIEKESLQLLVIKQKTTITNYITLLWTNVIITMSDWLLFNNSSAIFQKYHGENKLIFNEMMMRSALF